MATKYFALLTNIGAAKLANATALGAQVEITQMAVGDGNGVLPTPNPAQTALTHELRRAQLNMLTIDPVNTNQIIAEQVIPEDAGGWWIREIGLFDKDGDMIAVANCAETYKPQLQEGSGRVQVIRVILIVSSTEAVTLKIDPSVVLATRKYVDDAVIEVKAYADDVMKKHVAAANPHKQYPLIANALKEMVDAGLVNQILENLGLGASAFGLQNIVVFNTPGVSNWNVPEALQQGRKCQVTVIGGGASGGSTTDITKRGGGGGGGGYSKLLLDLTDVSSVTVTVGSAGAGVTTGNGASGGSSSFGSYLSATGGQYGYGGTSTSGGSSGDGIGGDVNQGLGWGDDGSANSANCGGNGGGPGGQGSTVVGMDATGYGGGGGGITANSSNKSGSGKNGIVIIEW